MCLELGQGQEQCGEVVRFNRTKDQVGPEVMGSGLTSGLRAGSRVRDGQRSGDHRSGWRLGAGASEWVRFKLRL